MAENAVSSVDEDTASSTESMSPPKKVQPTKTMETKTHTTHHHPKYSDMIEEAIKKLEERGGSSVIAIKRYIAGTYKLDPENITRYIKPALKSAVESGSIIQTKGKGASGSFKLPSKATTAAKLKEAKLAAAGTKGEPAKKQTVKKTVKKTESTQSTDPTTEEPAKKQTVKKTVKKTESTQSTDTTKKQASSKVTKKDDSSAMVKNPKTKNAIPKSPKAKKSAKSPTTKPKAPKPKKVTAGTKSPKAPMMSTRRAVVAK